MSYVYVPEREVTDPAGIADALSESLANVNYGSWIKPIASINLSLDTTKVESRLSSIRIESPSGASDYYGGVHFVLLAPIDMSIMEKFQFDIAGRNKGGWINLPGTGLLIFEDAYGNQTTANLGFPTDASWVRRTYLKASFSPNPSFDWTKVLRWIFYWDTDSVNPFSWDGYDVWIDAGPFFYYIVTLPKLSVASIDVQGKSITGKSVQLTNPQGLSQTYPLPFGPVGLSGLGIWTLTILDADFVKWSDNDLSKTKSFQVDYNIPDISFVAIFQSGIPDGDGGGFDNNLIIAMVVIAGGLLVGGTLIYFIRKRRVRRTA